MRELLHLVQQHLQMHRHLVVWQDLQIHALCSFASQEAENTYKKVIRLRICDAQRQQRLHALLDLHHVLSPHHLKQK